MEITPEVQELINSKINEVQKSFEEEKDKILSNSKKLLSEKKNLEERLSQFDGFDIDDYKQLKKALQDKEDEDLLKSGKLEELVNKKAQGIRIELENQLKEKDRTIEEIQGKYKDLNHSFDNYRVRDALVAEARSAKVLDSAVEDLILRAQGLFSIDSEGKIVSLDKEGNIRTLDGQALTPKTFVQSLKKTAPHLWPQSEGASLRGSGDDGSPFGRGSSLDEAARRGDMKAFRKARQAQKSS